MDKVTGQCPQTAAFLKRRRAEAVSNRGSSAYQPNALPLGQTGSLGRAGLPVPNKPCDLCGRKATLNSNTKAQSSGAA